MSLFQCAQCGCCENTALAPWTYPKERICSACGEGKWHDVFPRTYLPKGQFVTNNKGNLAHRKTGSEDFENFALPQEDGTCPPKPQPRSGRW